MNKILKKPLQKLGYEFIAHEFLPKGKDEYYLRDKQHANGREYRQLNASEIEVLVRNNNTSDNWNMLFVTEDFNARLVMNCHFFGKIRIGKLEPYYLEFNNLRVPVGLYNSTICSCDIGDNVVIENVAYLSHYIIGNEVIIANVNEMSTTNYSKFGNGIVKEGESENVRIWMELCNENGGRKVMPFEGMLPGDAFLWTRHRDDAELIERFKDFTQRKFDKKRGYYGIVGDRTVIKNCKIIKDVRIGTDAYLKGANKIKNLTINSSAEARSQIGEGCELVNGIMDYGCRVFYGVKAVRFVMASQSNLKYGARLINSYLGSNATVSCCEVLNSLIFPAHEQHHNNSFLCAALVMGQSNMAAGATIGSNHNSRGADGEIIAGRGFWPGLCVSLKHNSRFATFTLIAKGDYPAEIDLPIPFSLLVHEESENCLKVMPGYWFMYNFYALARNSWKYVDRDQRKEKIQHIEYDFLAPDSVEEMFHALRLMEISVAKACMKEEKKDYKHLTEKELADLGKKLLLENPDFVDSITINIENIQNSDRPVTLIKVRQAYPIYKRLIKYYGVKALLDYLNSHSVNSFEELLSEINTSSRTTWHNVGGQLMPDKKLQKLISNIKSGKIKNWDEVHDYYLKAGNEYEKDKLLHAIASMLEVLEITINQLNKKQLKSLINESVKTKEWIANQIYVTREKDYTNPFRRMAYSSQEEMEAVIGKIEDNSFIKETFSELEAYKKQAKQLIKKLAL